MVATENGGRVAGIIAEFNPFHSGHKYLIDRAREDGANIIVAVMSGNFVQRGEPAIFDKNLRARCALQCGIDLVVELPVPYAVAGAQKFASAGVKILESLGTVDDIFFGSECGDTLLLKRTADLLESEEVNALIKEKMKQGVTFAAARQAAVAEISPESAGVLKNPNDILGVEYISALNKSGCSITPHAVKRKGVSHDASEPGDGFAAASLLREKIKRGESLSDFVPQECIGLIEQAAANRDFINYDRYEAAVLYSLLTSSPQKLALCPDCGEGLENRIFAFAQKAENLAQLFDTVKTKRYTHARIRRIVLSDFLGITAAMQNAHMPYIGVLGFNDAGRAILRRSKNSAALPVITKPSALKNCGREAADLFSLTARCDKIYSFLLFRETGSE